MKGIYLGAFKAKHEDYNIVYQDINGKRDLSGDMLDIDLSDFDYVIATPPCNYYSRANYRRDSSLYALRTKHLLPCILNKLRFINKPFIVENVRNKPMFIKFGLFSDFDFIHVYEIGRHTYWTNVHLEDYIDLLNNRINYLNKTLPYDNRQGRVQNRCSGLRQGGDEVHIVIDYFLKIVHTLKEDILYE